jgi:hypothetical protein
MACAHELFGLFRLFAVGLAYLTGSVNHPAQERRLNQAWQVLSPCAETTSFNGAWTLSLKEDGTALVVSEKAAQRLQGRWMLVNAETHAYRIDVLAFGNDFVVVPTISGCLLGSGTLNQVDLRQSWFSQVQRDGRDLLASASGPRVAAK